MTENSVVKNETSNSTDLIQWLQRKYIPVPGSVSVSSEEVYSLYMKEHCGTVLSKRTFGRLVPQLFENVTKVHLNGPSKYRGLRKNFFCPEPCTTTKLAVIASKYGFVNLPEGDGLNAYICYSGYTVNIQKQLKTIKISDDNSVTVLIGEIEASMSDIGLTNITMKTTEDANIVFNTVRQAKVCRGKPVDKKADIPTFGKKNVLQQWKRNGDGNSFEYRLSSKKCKGVLPFNATASSCLLCQQQTIKRKIKSNA